MQRCFCWISPWTLCGALVGASLAAWTRAARLDRPVTLLLWLPAALLMTAAATGRRRGLLRGAALLLCAQGLLGGIVQALYGATGSLTAAYALGAAGALGIAAAARRRQRCAAGAATVRVQIDHRGCRAVLEGMLDSGNTLCDYVTGRPVIVLPAAAQRSFEGVLTRPIFADTAGGRQMMACFTPEQVQVADAGERRCVQAAAAFCTGLKEGAPALVPPSLLYGA